MMSDWYAEDIDNDFYREEDVQCPTCEGTGQVNPLTQGLPKDFICFGTTECPCCDGTGSFYY